MYTFQSVNGLAIHETLGLKYYFYWPEMCFPPKKEKTHNFKTNKVLATTVSFYAFCKLHIFEKKKGKATCV